ncbi:MAG TPA: chitobiase/beta-hexosaminidase C-terminal domain-containing protein, partial [Sumerlaeia bacterium]|nr:chitobiase/beta-hexosaminidase C-terminal domain-containing protein [Sumerlaeia bacterium]
FRDHPALLAWYISDEPSGHGASPEHLERMYRVVRELDPYHPVTIVFQNPAAGRRYAGAMDLTMTDPYPLPGGTPVSAGEYVRSLKTEFGHEKPVWVVPQCFGGNEAWMREPTPGEQRVMTFLAILEGATGVQYFIRHGLNGFPKSTTMWGECAAMALEIAEVAPALLSREPRPSVVAWPECVRAGAWTDRGLVTILAVNASNTPLPARVALQDLFPNGEARLVFEDRRVPVVNGVVNDIIDAYGSRAYQIRIAPPPPDRAPACQANILLDSSFEANVVPGVPTNCYAHPGRGAVCQVDSRDAVHGRHSLRMHCPDADAPVGISPHNIGLRAGQGYTLSVWARSLPPTPVLTEPAQFELSFNAHAVSDILVGKKDEDGKTPLIQQTFTPTAQWRRYTVSGVCPGGGHGVVLRTVSPGVVWFDLLELVADPAIQTGLSANREHLTVSVKTSFPDTEIRYTLNGARPTGNSERYDETLSLDRSTTLTIGVFRGDRYLCGGRAWLCQHAAIACPVKHAFAYSDMYPGGGSNALTDGIRAEPGNVHEKWQGFLGRNMTATIDLEREVEISRIHAGFLAYESAWIYLPKSVEFLVSADGREFAPVADMPNDEDARKRPFVKEFKAQFESCAARYVRVHARTVGKQPGWSAPTGGEIWIFADEIQVNPGE